MTHSPPATADETAEAGRSALRAIAASATGAEVGSDVKALAAADDGAKRAAWRGAHDALAVSLRYRDADQGAGHPAAVEQLLDTLEACRCEHLGSRDFRGVRSNLFVHNERLSAAAEHLEVPDRVPQAVGQWMRASLAKRDPGPAAHALIQSVSQEVALPAAHTEDPSVTIALDVLRRVTADSSAFRAASLSLLEVLGLVKAAPSNEAQDIDPGDHPDEGVSESPPLETEDGDAPANPDDQKREVSDDQPDGEPDDATSTMDEAVEQEMAAKGDRYSAFTFEFDAVQTPMELSTPVELQRLRAQMDEALNSFAHLTKPLAQRLQRVLLARRTTRWRTDVDEGLLNPGRLARLVTQPSGRGVYREEVEHEERDTAVTLLIDSSGSMRGRCMTMAACCCEIMAAALERCRVTTEILGFTTRSWKGGRVRQAWEASGSPRAPGRLNELLHIVYKDAATPFLRARRHLGIMLKESLLKENIDGEALLWAHERLSQRPERRKILIVISDGAPVDDSTLSVNPSILLDRHLKAVAKVIERHSPVELKAIGIGHDVGRYYSHATSLYRLEQLGETLGAEFLNLFVRSAP